MIIGTHFNTPDAALAFFYANDWTEYAMDTWISPCGTHIASLRPVRVIALDVQPAPVVAVDVAFVGARQ